MKPAPRLFQRPHCTAQPIFVALRHQDFPRYAFGTSVDQRIQPVGQILGLRRDMGQNRHRRLCHG